MVITVARQARVGVIRELSTSETASYSLMTARNVRAFRQCNIDPRKALPIALFSVSSVRAGSLDAKRSCRQRSLPGA
eukprot:6208328-Pleurochrysis_carterae.AAC.1